MVVAEEHRRGELAVLNFLLDGELLRRGGQKRQRPCLQPSFRYLVARLHRPGNWLSSVSCPTASFCVAVDGYGNAFTYNGSTWSSPKSIDAGNTLESVSCPTASFCAAVDYSGNAFTYNGSTWSSPKSIDAGVPLYSVSCASASFCAAVDKEGNLFTYVYPAPLGTDTVLTLSAANLTYGDEQVEQLSVSVYPQGYGPPPTGTVTVRSWPSWTTLCTIALSPVPSGSSNAVGSCALSATQLAVGSYDYGIAATYSGDANFDGSDASLESLTVGPAVPSTPTISNIPASATYGGKFTAIVSTTGDGVKSVRTNSTSVCAVSGLVVSYVGVGTCSVTAHVAAGTDYSAANGTAQTRRVGQAYSGTTLKLSATRVTYGDEEAEHLSVIVLPQYSGTMVTGTVTVKESKTTLCAIGLRSGKGSCRLSASRLKAGRYGLVATYEGTRNFKVSTSAEEILTVAK